MKFLDEIGLTAFWEKIKKWVGDKLAPILSDIKKIFENLHKIEEDVEYLRETLYPHTITSSVDGGNIRQKGKSFDIVLRWQMKRGEEPIICDTVTINDIEAFASEVAANSKTFPKVASDITYNISAKKGRYVRTTEQTIKFYSGSYFGKSTKDIKNITPADIRGGELVVSDKKGVSFEYVYNKEYAFYAYPKEFGLITKVVDGNNFECMIGAEGDKRASFVYKEIILDNNEAYYIYVFNSPIQNTSKIKFVFS